MKKFWEFKAEGKEPDRGELYLYGEISDQSWWGDEVTPALFAQELSALGEIKELDMYVNSPGGDVFAGMSIYNILNRHTAQVTAHIDGLAASAASAIVMAADKIIMPQNATLMIHNASVSIYGQAEKLRTMADELDRINGQLADIYAARTGADKEEIKKWMAEETWMDGNAALEKGFADEVTENKQIAACAEEQKWFASYQHPPKKQEKEPPKGGFSVPEKQAEVQGGVSEPVADKEKPDLNGLADQKKRFYQTRKKLLKGC